MVNVVPYTSGIIDSPGCLSEQRAGEDNGEEEPSPWLGEGEC